MSIDAKTDAPLSPEPTDQGNAALPLVKNLLEIAQLVAPNKICAALDSAPSAQVQALMCIIDEIRKRVSDQESGSALYRELTISFDDNTYVLPIELADVHPRLVEYLNSGKSTSQAPNRGLLLYGVPGTGKTEYIPYLRSKVDPKKARFVVGNISPIRNSNFPGEKFEGLVRQLEAEARGGGYTIVLFFDEFDKLINKFMKMDIQKTTITSDSLDQKRPRTDTTLTEGSSLEFDDKGDELLGAFKALMGGISAIEHVFIVATSNQEHFLEAMIRDGRLEPVVLRPFGIEFVSVEDQGTTKKVARYDSYRETIPRHLAIMQAVAHRKNADCPNPVIDTMQREIMELLASIPCQTPLAWGGRLIVNNDYNSSIVEKILVYFGYEPERFNYDARKGFSGLRNNHRSINGYSEFNESAEALYMTDATPAAIAGYYKLCPKEFTDIASAKRAFAQLIFPSLRVADDSDLYK